MGISNTAGLLVRACRTYQSYPLGHEMRQLFLSRLFETLSSHLKMGKVGLQVEELRVLDESGEELLKGEKEDPFPWVLYKNGIRGVTFLPGLTTKELDTFISLLVNRSSDLLYYLLEEDLPHVVLEVAEYLLLAEEVEIPGKEEWSPPKESYIFEEFEPPYSGEVLKGLALTPEDTAYIEEALRRESERDHLSIYLDTVLSVFAMEEYQGLAADIMRSLEHFAMESLILGDPWVVLNLLRRLADMREEGKLDQKRIDLLDAFMTSLGSPAALDLIRKHYSPSWGGALKELLLRLDPPHTDRLLGWLEEEKREEVKKALVELIKKKAEALPGLLVSFFTKAGPKGKREIVDLTWDLREEEVRRLLEVALDSEEEAIRRAAVKAMLRIDPSTLSGLVERFFKDGGPAFRVLLLDAINEVGGVPSLAPMLYQELSESDFFSRDYLERRFFFIALLASSEEAFKQALRDLLAMVPGWKMRKKWRETVGIALNVAIDAGGIGVGETKMLVKGSENKGAEKVWESVLEAREGIQ